MRKWTLEERYKTLESSEQIKYLHEKIAQSPYRQLFHIQPVTGLSSDPNGFIFHNGKWHLFYQWCPWGAVHGLKYWYHVSSPDLIFWKNEGIGLKPDTIYDNKGVHSGSAFNIGNDLYLFYTGNHRDENWIRTPWTCAAKLVNGKFQKLDKPLFGPLKNYSEHQRDPKVFYNEKIGKYFILLGAQTEDKKGTALVYSSDNPLENWEFKGELKVKGYENFAGMWECPSLQKIGEDDLLIFSPQYIKLDGRGNSTNHNIYFIGKMDYDTLTFYPYKDFEFLDYGFDFYAAQLASNIPNNDRAIMISWIGLPDNHYPTEEEDWEGSMTIPRELTIKNGNLIQKPITGIEKLREKKLELDGILTIPSELQIDILGEKFNLKLFTKQDGTGGFSINYNKSSNSLTVSKKEMTNHYNEEIGEVLEIPLKKNLKSLRIFLDKSSIEIFINNGESTFTSHIYPTDEEIGYDINGDFVLTAWNLRTSVKDDFIV